MSTDTHDMVVVHRVFRREFNLLPALIGAVADGNRHRARVLSGHLDLMVAALHEHHTGEDELLWPVLLDRVTLKTELVTRMEMQHEVVADALDRVRDAARSWRGAGRSADRDRLVDALVQVSTALVEHLNDEEQLVLPLAATHLTQSEWDRLAARARKALPPGPAALVQLGALLEETSADERRWFLAGLPAPVRLLWRAVGARYYTRQMSRVRDDHPLRPRPASGAVAA